MHRSNVSMPPDSESAKAAYDRPLDAANASAHDQLDRLPFAQAVVEVLALVNRDHGLTVSVEGPWGSGKTSAMAIIEEQLRIEARRSPVFVHFNPWLVGDRDALLRQFLGRIAEAVELTDSAEAATKVAKQLTSYAKLFDVVKWIPGAEPMASIVKGVLSGAGHATAAIAKEKSANLEKRKEKVEKALRAFPRRIIVFLDDMDRLMPIEVYEMVRILKAVADLPNIGHVVAWDPRYVNDALASVHIPHADGFLDKIVQFRMPLPRLAGIDKETLVNQALEAMPSDALREYFPGAQGRLSVLYAKALRDLLEHPRDIHRVFNTVRTIEPSLRGEIVLADIIGLAALMVRCSPVFHMLQRHPRRFVGSLPDEISLLDAGKNLIQAHAASLEDAIEACVMPNEARALVRHLFPQTEPTDGKTGTARVMDTQGQIASPMRLAAALRMSIGSTGVSLKQVRDYLFEPASRSRIGESISSRSALEFMERLGEMASTTRGEGISDPIALGVAMATLTEAPGFVERANARGMLAPYIGAIAEIAIDRVIQACSPGAEAAAAKAIIEDPQAITMGMLMMEATFFPVDGKVRTALRPDAGERARLTNALAKHILAAAQAGTLLSRFDPGVLLRGLARLSPPTAAKVYAAMAGDEATLDGLATALLLSRISSDTGASYRLPADLALVEAYGPLPQWRTNAERRLRDTAIKDDAAAAWLSVLRGVAVHARGFTQARD
ncbi:P-loop NTPase fold protein [Dyella sp. 333MFSha]|uniref:KAP family P-loop NTPase fold protein n=1 Tax=Dyella sp. 333MFSha TaxID=1798240 RepID=UPI00088DC2F3|nr:P-loop NTPase fold protein [Dyella sp. 333MFSha]SDF39733.1 KAP family P-loop domain-containing protein [Dyella sp. 333MFSha]